MWWFIGVGGGAASLGCETAADAGAARRAAVGTEPGLGPPEEPVQADGVIDFRTVRSL